MKSLSERLAALAPTIEEICKISGTPGLSIGVLHHGEIIHRTNYGLRDIEAKLPPDADTIFHIASLTKCFTAAAAAILVDEGHFRWDTPIVILLPDFSLRDNFLTKSVTVLDVVSNRIGITSGGSVNSHGGNKVWLDKKDLLPTLSTFEAVTGFRTKMQYNNHAFGIIPEIIERVTGESYGTFVTKRIFTPLRMDRSVIITPGSPTENIAKAYATLDDASPCEIPRPGAQDGTSLAAAGGIRSSINDLLKFYKGLMQAARAEDVQKGENSITNPFRQVKTLLQAHIIFDPNAEHHSYYGGGLASTQLPGVLGSLGLNPLFVHNRPVIGRGAKPTLVHWHQGSYPGFLSSVMLVTETQSAIIVLTNSLALNDAADWICQLLLQTVIADADFIDWVKLAQESRDSNIARHKQVAADLEAGRKLTTSRALLQDFVGRYFNAAGSFHLDVRKANADALEVFFGGHDDDAYDLRPYDEDVFEWHVSREIQAKRARWPRMNEHFWKFSFTRSDDGKVDGLIWVIDPLVPRGEKFVKGDGYCALKLVHLEDTC